MGQLSSNFKKEDVFYFSKEVKYLMDLLNGTIISCNDKIKFKYIEKQINKIENLTYKFESTVYEEYSAKTKFAYNNMIKAKKEYTRVVAEKCYKRIIKEYKKKYEDSVEEYI